MESNENMLKATSKSWLLENFKCYFHVLNRSRRHFCHRHIDGDRIKFMRKNMAQNGYHWIWIDFNLNSIINWLRKLLLTACHHQHRSTGTFSPYKFNLYLKHTQYISIWFTLAINFFDAMTDFCAFLLFYRKLVQVLSCSHHMHSSPDINRFFKPIRFDVWI